jgi:hypothetical protein
MCRHGQYDGASDQLRTLYAELERAEPQNAGLFRANAQLFSRLCGRDQHVLEATAALGEKAASIDPTSSLNMAEVGYQSLLRNKIKDAQR